ncbi:hypothetical protein T05_15960 [Trichinella murrelli]|uniref:Uncharacterized protein n=1 Tax=Trichinella murrelli TaxID=144512 RepID=A0A0V0TTS0_9BILA|nr:hypothetical protein T05_15960 [Trichinella murrelli]
MQCLKRHEGRADITSGDGGEMLCRRYRRPMSTRRMRRRYSSRKVVKGFRRNTAAIRMSRNSMIASLGIALTAM